MRHVLTWLLCTPFLLACTPNQAKDENQAAQEVSAGIEKESEGVLGENIEWHLHSDYEIWKAGNQANFDLKLHNPTDTLFTSSVLPFVFIYPKGEKEAIGWSLMDLSNSLNLGPERYSVISLPSQKTLVRSPKVDRLQWAQGGALEWPDKSLYEIIEPGEYEVGMTLVFYEGEKKLSDQQTNRISIEISQ